MHTNIGNSLNLLEKFIFTEWKFHNNKTIELSNTLNETDKVMFNIDIRSLKWEEYFVSLTQGVRRYLNNEHPKTMDAARIKDNR
jgi:alcohol-forming fatty acyl-CoA reductase